MAGQSSAHYGMRCDLVLEVSDTVFPAILFTVTGCLRQFNHPLRGAQAAAGPRRTRTESEAWLAPRGTTTHELAHEFDWRGRTVRGDRCGSGPDLVLLHGTPWSSEQWRPFAEADERFTAEIEPGYGSITEPVHPIWGAEDAWIPRDRAERLRAAIPHTSLALIDDAGHMVQLDAPVAPSAELTRWTASVRT